LSLTPSYIPNMYSLPQGTFTLLTPILFACPIFYTGPLKNLSLLFTRKKYFICQSQSRSQHPLHQSLEKTVFPNALEARYSSKYC
jgi:hypothetical protein